MTDYPNPPGHPQAVADGCTCPVLDNAHGKGSGYLDADERPLYFFDFRCPLHGNLKKIPDETVVRRDWSEPAYGAAARPGEKFA